MEFDGIRPEQMGCVKVLSVSDRFTAATEQQTVTRRGVILASVSVPTVREISAELLVRGKTAEDVRLTLDKLDDWLGTGRMARLRLRHMKGTYYKARCTDIGPPSFSGASARLSVTFTCEDYRLYNLYNDQPVRGADPGTDNFTFAGKHCLNDMGCMFVISRRTGVPQPALYKYEISGLPGTLRYDAPDLPLKEGQLTGTLYFVGRDESGAPLPDGETEERLHGVAAWLIASGRAELMMDSDITRVYLAEIEDEAAFERGDWENGKLGVTLTLQPLAMDAQESGTAKTMTLAAGVRQAVDLAGAFPRGMGYTTPLVLEIANIGSAAVTDLGIVYRDALGRERTTRFFGAGFSLAAGQTLRVDAEHASSSIEGANAAQWLCSGEYPSASPGAEIIWVQTGAAAQVRVTVTARARWV